MNESGNVLIVNTNHFEVMYFDFLKHKDYFDPTLTNIKKKSWIVNAMNIKFI